jgi:hypothetical protein
VIDTNVVFAGVASVKVPMVIAEEPVLVTTCVYVIELPACTGLGEAIFVTERFGPDPPTIVVTVAVLFAGMVSNTDELTVAVAVMTVPFVVPVATFAINVKVAGLPVARFALVHTTLPVPPGLGD